MKLQGLQVLQARSSKDEKAANWPVTAPVTEAAFVEPGEVEFEERKGMAMGAVPEPYLTAWARLQCQRPSGIDEARWRQAIEDAASFLDAWGSLADAFGWQSADLFDCPRDEHMGLIWWLKGSNVTALGPEHACAGEPVFDRLTHADWQNPYHRK
jgi:hypothetical protein